ncbi:uncharacterized protein [Magallana gigas]|uniref:uncharacterized protein n=1 Tax=Magallana gigas TaxID=29159 RepID=UPI0033428669
MNFVFHVTVSLIVMFGIGFSAGSNYCKDNWVLIFHARSGNGKNVLQAWKTRHNNCDIVSQICPCSISDGCLPPNARIECLKSATETLRSPFIDYWDCLKIKKVKFELKVRGKTVAFIEFDGRNSNYLNWFHNSRILKSSWNDMHKSQTYNFFSIDKESRYYRHFFINKNYGGCPRDLGWLAVKDSANFRGACGWDKHNSYPQFLYGRNGKVTRWNDMKFGKAEDLNIYIQMGY